jgi:hypothetical protein
MKIRQENPQKKRRSTLQFPELLNLTPGFCAVYDISESVTVRAAIAYLKKTRGLEFKTNTFPETEEIKVWLKEPFPTTDEEKSE